MKVHSYSFLYANPFSRHTHDTIHIICISLRKAYSLQKTLLVSSVPLQHRIKYQDITGVPEQFMAQANKTIRLFKINKYKFIVGKKESVL